MASIAGGKVFPFIVVADLPDSLSPLVELASNLWWTWDHEARELFSKVATIAGEKLRNPFELVSSLPADAIAKLEKDPTVKQALSRALARYQRLALSKHPSLGVPARLPFTTAYFSAEFGLHESLPIYSGGLGVLAGDHLKAASELGTPLIGVGLLYYEGYFRQYLNNDGWQQEMYPLLELAALPLRPVCNDQGSPISIVLRFDNRRVRIRGWVIGVGRVPLVLLDTNLDDNEVRDRMICSRLYGGDSEMRIAQEFVLGVGGLRMLEAAGIEPPVCHMNEGHSAFLVLERIRQLRTRNGLSFEEALLAVKRSSVFTTHTPVPAGNDTFHPDLAHRFLRELAEEMGHEPTTLLQLGRFVQNDNHEPFSMTVLALRGANHTNGVSKLHGEVSRKLWSGLWPGLSTPEIPISHVTNGAHVSTWVSTELAALWDQSIGTEWREPNGGFANCWDNLRNIPIEQLWKVRSLRRAALIETCRERIAIQLKRRGALRREIEVAQNSLRDDVLTIGFARRFATYKRGNLILRDLDRLCRLLNHSAKPVQLIYSGKSHPADRPGKEIIAEIAHSLRRSELEHRIVFLEDYDMGVARKLVQGVDVWLNNPRRPMEASGTSGMKAAFNGALNVSVLDGWWCEAYDETNGWSIGQGEEYHDINYQDEVESRALYDTLEQEVVPLFYERNGAGIPEAWLERVKASLATIVPQFDARRMVSDYMHFYSSAFDAYEQDSRSHFGASKDQAAKIAFLRERWQHLRILQVTTDGGEHIPRGGALRINAEVLLGDIPRELVTVQACVGRVDASGSFHPLYCSTLNCEHSPHQNSQGPIKFSGDLVAQHAGRFGFSVRLVPNFNQQANPLIPGLLTWAN